MDSKKVVDIQDLAQISHAGTGFFGKMAGLASLPRTIQQSVQLGKSLFADRDALGALLQEAFAKNGDGTVGLWKKKENPGHTDYLISGATLEIGLREVEDRTVLTGGPLAKVIPKLRAAFEQCADRRDQTANLKPVLSMADVMAKAAEMKQRRGG